MKGYYTLVELSWRGEELEMSLGLMNTTGAIAMLPLPHPKDRSVSLLQRQNSYVSSLGLRNLTTDIATTTADPKVFEQIHRWLMECEGHDQCSRVRSSGYVPTRLLEIVKHSCRLVDGSGLQVPVEYISLSYCWGKDDGRPRLELTVGTEQELRTGLAVARLPKTYQHAIRVAKQLNIRYLWIDRLCILQHNKDDWEIESSSMRKVYESAYLTVAASASDHDDGGLFRSRRPQDIVPTVVQIRKETGDKKKPYICTREYTLPWFQDFCKSPLLSRGWVVQERVLSPRVLYFGSKMLSWECWQRCACELHPVGASFAVNDKGLDVLALDELTCHPLETRPWKPLLDSPRTHPTAVTKYDEALFDWVSVLKKYADCHLSHSTDRLVAIQGLADRGKMIFQEHRPNLTPIYLAGHWESTLPWSLLWRPGRGSKRYETFVAPSWSWASLDRAAINWDQYVAPGELDSLHCAYGGYRVGHGSRSADVRLQTVCELLLTGPLLQCTVDEAEEYFRGFKIKRLHLKATSTKAELHLDKSMYVDAFAEYDNDESEPPMRTYWMPMITRFGDRSHELACLILTKDGQTFQRIGIITSMLWNRDRSVVEWINGLPKVQIVLA
jgi:hypothetical protein